MPRVNVYIPDDLYLALRTYTGDINVSRVCADALRAALAARADVKPLPAFFHPRDVTATEEDLMMRYKIPACIVGDPRGSRHPREIAAVFAADFIDRTIAEGMPLALGGGAQMYEVATLLRRHNVGVPLWAIGCGHVDAELPHLHPNTLVTLLSLLYAPRSTAHLVGAAEFEKSWRWPSTFPPGQGVQRIIVGSCSMFDADSPYARTLGDELTDFLVGEHVMGDFLGVFLCADGRIVEPYAQTMTVSHISAVDLCRFAKRDDTIVMLATTGLHKIRLIRQVLEQGLCNMLVTDERTAAALK